MSSATISIRSEEREPADLVAMAVHDLKTPLAALRQALQLVGSGRAGELGERQARFVAMAMDNAQVLASLLDRLHGTISGRSSADDVRPQRLDAAEVATFVVRALQPSAECRGMRLDVRCAPGVSPAWADPVLVRRVLLNLVGNAVKYAACGGVATVLVERHPDDPSVIALRVRDRGPGLPESEHELVFATRRRSDATCAGQDGLGLGLAIVRDVARAHGGHATVANNRGSGCTFTVTLPAFGSGRGAATQLRLARSSERRELVALQAREGCSERLADRLAFAAPAAWRVLDLGAGRFGVVRPAEGNAAVSDGIAALLGEGEAWIAARGRAELSETDPESVIATALSSLTATREASLNHE